MFVWTAGTWGELSRIVRKELDDAGLGEAKIVASNDLDEYSISVLSAQAAPIDAYGVGTRLVTANDDPALGGVYKLMAVERGKEQILPVKVSDDPDKSTMPGVKQVYRWFSSDGKPQADLLSLANEEVASPPGISAAEYRPLLVQVMNRGRICSPLPSLEEVRHRREEALTSLPDLYCRLDRPQVYPLLCSPQILALKESLYP